MKKQLLLIFVLAISACAFSQGFDKSKLRAGVGLLYATDISNLGFKIDGAYSFNTEWEGDLTFSHIFKKDYTTFNALDFDAHYYFAQLNDKFNIYGLAGLNTTFVKFDNEKFFESYKKYGYSDEDINYLVNTSGGAKSTTSNVGLNLGIGAKYTLNDKINLLPEIRYSIINGSYLRIGVSAQYSF